MCRLFGFRSVFKSKMHRSLTHAENALAFQSEKHPDGWGVAYYINDIPHMIKSTNAAIEDSLFEKVSGVVQSETVLAHLRKTTIGENTVLNTHPFQFGSWTFAHNGNIKNFEAYKDKLIKLINTDLVSYKLGTTDSEIIFYIILSEIKSINGALEEPLTSAQLTELIRNAISKITQVTGPHSTNDSDPPTETFLSFILTNGRTMVSYNGGKTLYFSTHKTSCPDETSCPHFNETCVSPLKRTGKEKQVNHLLIASEPTLKTNIWELIPPGKLVGVDDSLIFFEKTI